MILLENPVTDTFRYIGLIYIFLPSDEGPHTAQADLMQYDIVMSSTLECLW